MADSRSPETSSAREARLRAMARAAGQEHVFQDWERLGPAARTRLLEDVDGLDFSELQSLRSLLRAPSKAAAEVRLEPPEVFPLQRDRAAEKDAEEARALGRQALQQGRVGYVLVAGGQASRLGYDGPKGAFRLGPLSGWSLFEIHARRLRAAAARHGVRVPWYVMTSRANDAATRGFFAEHGHFGLDPADVFFFSQAMMPAMDFEGRVLLSEPGALFLAPNGHGGVLAALRASGALDDARRRGLELFSYFQVDNPLAPPADPLFLGLHLARKAGMSSKVVAKRDAGEKVGVLGRIDGRMGCIEYSDLPDELRSKRTAQGRLLFDAGNIAMHVLSVDFVDGLTAGPLRLPWHLARKEMNVWQDGRMRAVKGAKFETFVFDALGESPSSVTLEVERAREFSPVKNKDGEDSPATARADLSRLHAAWIEGCGLTLPPPSADGVPAVEIDPLLAEDVESFRQAAGRGPLVVSGGHFYRLP